MSERARRLLPLAAAAFLLLVPYREFFTERVPVSRDLLFYFYPAKAALAEAVRAGEIPWIDRYRWGGVPLLPAPGTAPFDPGNLLYLVLPLGAATKAWILIRALTGLTGFAAFGRRIGLSPWGAAAAGLLFALSGPTVSAAPFLSTPAAHSLLPWLAAFVLDVRGRPDAGSSARLAAIAALILVSGSPEYVLYGAVVAGALLLGPPVGGDSAAPAPARRVAGSLAVAALVAGALSAPAILGGVTSVSESSRTSEGGYGLAAASVGAVPPARLVEFLSDGLVADWTRVFFAPGYGTYYPHLPSITPGRVALVLAVLGFALGDVGRFRALGLAFLAVLLAVGPATPFWGAAARVVPIVGTVRFPERHLLLSAFALAWLAALGLRGLERRLSPSAARTLCLLLLPLTLLDREGVARRLVYTAPGEILTSRPAALAGWPGASPGTTPPRFVHRDSLVPVPKFLDLDVVGANRLAAETLSPEYPALFGVASLFALDYDLTLPAEAVEWTRLLQSALPGPGPLPLRFLRAAGAAAVVRSEPSPGGRWVPRVERISEPLPPWRFASRVVADPDGRQLFRRFLEEGVDAGTAYVEEAPAAESRPSPGRLVSVRDGGDGLTVVAEVDGPSEGFLMVYRLRQAAVEATVDGRRVGVSRMAFGFAGLRVPPGRHIIRLRPDTRWVKMGVVAMLAGGVALVVLSLRARRRRTGAPAA